jgi:hypothetical protein
MGNAYTKGQRNVVMVMSQAGRASILLIVICAALGLGLVASLYLNYDLAQRADQDRKQMKGEITDLRYQLKQDQEGVSPQASASPSPSPSPSPSGSPVLGAQSVDLVQLGVKLAPVDPIADLTYSYQLVSGLATANLTTTSLLAKYPACKPNTALGMIVRRPLNSKPNTSASKLIKKLGDYNYYYVPSTAGCANDAAGRAMLAADRAALVNTVLPTLSN